MDNTVSHFLQLSRRNFVAGAISSLTFAALAKAPLRPKKCPTRGIGVQLYSIRELMNTKESFKAALAKVKEIGFDGVEFAGYGGYGAAELARILDDLGLGRAGSHISLDDLMPDRIQSTIEFNQELGNRLIVIPWATIPEHADNPADEWKKLGERMEKAAVTLKKAGIRLGYHNHHIELRDKIGNTTPFDIIYKNAPHCYMQLDVGNVVHCGFDPAQILKNYPRRSFSLHAKDVDGVLGNTCADGVNWDTLLAAAKKDRVEWYIVECVTDPTTYQHIQKGFEFLKERLSKCR